MKCAFCRKEFNEKEVTRKNGCSYLVEYGCCSQECLTRLMTGETPLEDPVEKRNTFLC